jgi:ferredoxin
MVRPVATRRVVTSLPADAGEARRAGDAMRILVDLNRCQSYGQCVFAAPGVFEFRGEEELEYEYAPDDALRLDVERAAAACPVGAIRIERSGTFTDRVELAGSGPTPPTTTPDEGAAHAGRGP